MDSKDAFEKVITILTPYAKNEKGLKNISEKSRIVEDLGINSARMLDIVADFEDKFQVRIEAELADQMDTVGSAVKILSDKIRK